MKITGTLTHNTYRNDHFILKDITMDLVEIQIDNTELDNQLQQTVNSREVYNFLGIKTEYPLWITRTIEKFDFVDGVDFTIFKNEGLGNRPRTDYIVTMDMAKELCMITNTPKGKETRKYFIAAEKEAHKQKPLTSMDLIIATAQELKKQEERVTTLEHKVDSLTINKTVLPKTGFASIGELAIKTSFSKNMVKVFIDLVNPKKGSALKTLPDGSVKPYTTYKIKPITKCAKQVRRTAKPINANMVYFKSPLTGNKKFQLI